MMPDGSDGWMCPTCGDKLEDEDTFFLTFDQCEKCQQDEDEEEPCPDCGEPMDEGECPYWCDRDEDDED